MKACIIFTGTGPILILTSYESFTDSNFAEKLASKGIKKYVACELDNELVRRKYGAQYDKIINDVKQSHDLRVLDYNGHNVFYNFSFKEMGEPIRYELEEELEEAAF
jgi:hypothetical protein